MPYATRDHVFQLGFSAQAFAVYGRAPQAVEPVTGRIKYVAHGLSDQDLVTIEAADGADFPPALSQFETYGVRCLSGNIFQLTLHGAVVTDFGMAGNGWTFEVDSTRRLDLHLVERAGFIDEHLVAHKPPILPSLETNTYPIVLVGLNARLAARSALPTLAFENAEYRESIERLQKLEEPDNKLLQMWLQGKPLNPRPRDSSDAADNGAVATSTRDGNEWPSEFI